MVVREEGLVADETMEAIVGHGGSLVNTLGAYYGVQVRHAHVTFPHSFIIVSLSQSSIHWKEGRE